jgi:predicted nucleic acid-binding protein
MPAEGGGLFFDTNVLLYLISGDLPKARQLDVHLLQGGMISVQVLNELTNVARRKYGLHTSQIRPFLMTLREALVVLPLSLEVHETGLGIIERYGLSTYDAMVVAAALHGNCGTVLNEDMQDGMSIYGKLRILNPFRA